MPKNAQDLYREALALSAEERDDLVRLLRAHDANGFATPEIEQAWIEEAERRIRLIDAGEAAMVPGDEFMRDLRKLVEE